MDYNVTSLVQEVKTRGKDPSISDDLITSWLQETQNGVLGHYRLPFLEEIVNDTLTIHDLTYEPPADSQVILGVKLTADNDITYPEFLSYQEFSAEYWNVADTTPTFPDAVTQYAGLLYWSAPLDKPYVLELRYLRKPVQFASGIVVPDIPVEYRELMVRGGLERLEEYRENFDIASLHARKREDLAEDMLQRYGVRQLVTPHRALLNGRQVGYRGHPGRPW